jgi:maleylacetate reductase
MPQAIGPFTYQQQAMTVVFGVNESERLVEHLEPLEPQRVLIVHGSSGAALADRVVAVLGARAAGAFTDLAQHVPAGGAERAVSQAIAAGVDTVVAIGGGSAIGYAKVIALRTGARIAAVPTTYAGSEMTPIWGLTQDGVKKTGRAQAVMPRVVVYDPLMTLTLSATASAASGMNAIAHAVDAMYAPRMSPLVATIGTQAIAVLAAALPAVTRRVDDLEARTEACYGAHLAALVLSISGMALHHRICHVLGGRFGLPHAQTHAVVLPYAVAYNERDAPVVSAQVAAALDASGAASALWELRRRLQLPAALEELGMRADDLEDAAAAIVASPVNNPAPVTYTGVLTLLHAAFTGAPPSASG